jgi:heme/copper-type cytochrome/quinol oxidase subunit 2
LENLASGDTTGPGHVAAPLASMKALTVLDPQSPEARAIFHLAIVSGIIFALIFIIVSGLIVYTLMRYRWREGQHARPSANP